MAQNEYRRQARMAQPMIQPMYEGDEQEITIDRSEIFRMIKKHIKLFFILTIGFGAVFGIYTKFMMDPIYASSATLYLTLQVSETGIADYQSTITNEKLVNNVVALMTQENIMNDVAKQTGMQSAQEVKDTLTVTNEANTELINVTSQTKDPKLSKEIVQNTVDTFISTMQKNLNLSNIEIVAQAKLSYVPVGPSLPKNTVIGAALGFVLAGAYVVFKVLTDKRLKTKEEAEKFLGLPVYCELPVFNEK